MSFCSLTFINIFTNMKKKSKNLLPMFATGCFHRIWIPKRGRHASPQRVSHNGGMCVLRGTHRGLYLRGIIIDWCSP